MFILIHNLLLAQRRAGAAKYRWTAYKQRLPRRIHHDIPRYQTLPAAGSFETIAGAPRSRLNEKTTKIIYKLADNMDTFLLRDRQQYVRAMQPDYVGGYDIDSTQNTSTASPSDERHGRVSHESG